VPLVRAVVEVLADWRPEADAVIHLDSATRPTLTRDLAEGVSRYLGLPMVGRVAIADPSVGPGRGAMNSAQRVAAVHRRYALDAVDVPARVLLVDDRMVTGWTITLAAHLLRRAGVRAVVPLVLAVES
jgi:ATP-dependent DNA helicase RecQ